MLEPIIVVVFHSLIDLSLPRRSVIGAALPTITGNFECLHVAFARIFESEFRATSLSGGIWNFTVKQVFRDSTVFHSAHVT